VAEEFSPCRRRKKTFDYRPINGIKPVHIMTELNGQILLDMLDGGLRGLSYHRKLVDALNVFPVPDGDTGTNMTLTLKSAVAEAHTADVSTIADVALKFSKGALKGARGNSGVILSQIIKGFAVAFVGKETATSHDFAEGMRKGTEIAYAAVTRPKEGTILTVIRVMAEAATEVTKKKSSEIDIIKLFDEILAAGEEALRLTPEQLPVLKSAGVVDAGGKGLLSVFEGFRTILIGGEMPEGEADEEQEAEHENEQPDLDAFSDEHDLENIKFAYCTEFFIINLNKATTTDDVDQFREALMNIGDCVLVIGDLQLVKVHVHTNEPDKAFRYALQMGELSGVKVENMLEQNRALKARAEEKRQEALSQRKDNALIAICAGSGFEMIFKDLGVDEVIEGGQTMNPSVFDILNAVNRVNANRVYVFPNNSNIILAANQVKDLTKTEVVVVPTKNVPQGITSVLAFMSESGAEENLKNMEEANARVKTGQVTHAVKNTRMNGFSIKEGDIIGLNDKVIVAKSHDLDETVIETVQAVAAEDSQLVTLYYGEDVKEEEAEALTVKLTERFPSLEVLAYPGGQPHYYYLFAIE
jgi:DAK2 domain fusion protein YloV